MQVKIVSSNQFLIISLFLALTFTIDISVNEKKNGKNLITISNPVRQRKIDGNTFGIAIKPLDVVEASFYSMKYSNQKYSAKLHFNIE